MFKQVFNTFRRGGNRAFSSSTNSFKKASNTFTQASNRTKFAGLFAATSVGSMGAAGYAVCQSDSDSQDQMFKLMGLLYKPHPWHGLTLGEGSPEVVTAYIECQPGEGIKYEIDKGTGYMKVDRPHKFSSMCPTIYGFLPQTYCGDRVAKRCMEKTGLTGVTGDKDPIDICVLSTRAINRGDIILSCRPIGGLRMIDDGEADDKIIAVVNGDAAMSQYNDIKDIPGPMLDLMLHYFLTYKQSPNSKKKSVSIPEIYGREEALEMVRLSHEDYNDKFSGLKADFAKSILGGLKRELASSLLSS